MKCPKCGEKMVDQNYERMMYFKCECGHEVKMSFDEWLLTDEGKKFARWQNEAARNAKNDVKPKS